MAGGTSAHVHQRTRRDIEEQSLRRHGLGAIGNPATCSARSQPVPRSARTTSLTIAPFVPSSPLSAARRATITSWAAHTRDLFSRQRREDELHRPVSSVSAPERVAITV